MRIHSERILYIYVHLYLNAGAVIVYMMFSGLILNICIAWIYIDNMHNICIISNIYPMNLQKGQERSMKRQEEDRYRDNAQTPFNINMEERPQLRERGIAI